MFLPSSCLTLVRCLPGSPILCFIADPPLHRKDLTMDDETIIRNTNKPKRKRLAAYSLAAMTAVGGGIGGLIIGAGALGAGAESDTGSTSTGATAGAAAPAPDGSTPEGFVFRQGPGAPGPRVDMLQIAADTIGVSVEELRTALEANKSIAQVAQEKGVDPQKVIDALVAARTKALDEAKAMLPERAKADVERQGLPQRPPGGPGHHRGPRVEILKVAAEAIGISEADLKAGIEADKSIAQVAQEKGVDPQKVIDALVAAHNKMIDEEVAAGRMEQAKADELKKNFPEHAKKIVEQVGRPERGPGGPGGPVGPRGPRPDAGTEQPPAPSTTTD